MSNKGKKLTWITSEHREKARLKMLGKKQSPETIEKRVSKIRGHKVSRETRIKLSKKLKGKKLSFLTRQKMSLSKRGIKRPPMSEEQKMKLSLSRIGKHYPNARGKLSGEKSHFWRGGVSTENAKIRQSVEYKIWRQSVFQRDNWTCIWCGARSEKGKSVYLEADHIKPFALFPELRFAIDNGRTLCRECHKLTDTYGVKLRIL